MSNPEDLVPLRCMTCHLFSADLEKTKRLENEEFVLRQETEQLERRGIPREDISLRLAQIAFELSEVRLQIAENIAYTVGCPGFDLSDSIVLGEPVRIDRCRSPLLGLD